MIAATPIYGGHYFVDLIFGTIVAILVCHGLKHDGSLVCTKIVRNHPNPRLRRFSLLNSFKLWNLTYLIINLVGAFRLGHYVDP